MAKRLWVVEGKGVGVDFRSRDAAERAAADALRSGLAVEMNGYDLVRCCGQMLWVPVNSSMGRQCGQCGTYYASESED